VKTVDLHRQATAEMIEAARVYEQRREGLGFRFIRVVEEVCDKIGQFPEAGAPLGRKERKRRVPRFPYDVVYKTMEGRILVLAIKHHRRRPGYWTWRRYR
jgi:plasmid stabilization system protein ParE